ncbi:MAG: BREX system Lon protease-like protein BrxL, partial [Firmicutes bacterium]|nr:BREX system Lon protease-like protein BrxL [Bacillota bacterium]
MNIDLLSEEQAEYDAHITRFDKKVREVFGNLAIDKRRLPMSQLQKRGVPAYVGEWLLESLVPGDGSLTPDEAQKVQQWTARYIPNPNDQNLIKNRLISGEILKVLTPVQVEIILRRRLQDRVAKLKLLGIEDAYIADSLLEKYPDLLKQGMWGVV